jgi:Domain of unknown function (DUF4381)
MMDEQFGNLIEPPRRTFTFGAPGWYVLGGLFLLVLLVLGIWWLRRYRRNRYRRQAIREIGLIQSRYAGSDIGIGLYEINMLVKRIAMTDYQRSETAGLRRSAWIDFLNRSQGTVLFDSCEDDLLEELYNGKTVAGHPEVFIYKVEEWIRKHKRAGHAFRDSL